VKRKRFSVEQITGILKQAEIGTPIAELCRQHGISDSGFAVSDSSAPRPPADAPGASDSNETASFALPVAVIASRATSSGGENVVIAFHGRAKTRLFGAQTAGLTSSNQAVDLPDGARLVVASGWPRDRDGRVYQTAIKPDQETCGQCSPIEEAKRWLEATPEPQWQNSR
jgi:hypothetical protein